MSLCFILQPAPPAMLPHSHQPVYQHPTNQHYQVNCPAVIHLFLKMSGQCVEFNLTVSMPTPSQCVPNQHQWTVIQVGKVSSGLFSLTLDQFISCCRCFCCPVSRALQSCCVLPAVAMSLPAYGWKLCQASFARHGRRHARGTDSSGNSTQL